MDILVYAMILWMTSHSVSAGPNVRKPSDPRRDITSFATICRLACISRCLQDKKIMKDCMTSCPKIDVEECEGRRCMPKECMKYKELSESTESVEKFRTHLGRMNPFQSISSLALNWTLPEDIFNDQQGPRLFYVELLENEEDRWTALPNILMPVLTTPFFTLTNRCEEADKDKYRLAAVNSGGLAAISPETQFFYNKHATFLPVSNLTLGGLEFKSERVQGRLSWTLPLGITTLDVKKYLIRPTTTYCDPPSSAVVRYIPGTQTADVTNMRMNCSYEFNVVYTTVCEDKQSPEVSIKTTVLCQNVAESGCSATQPNSGSQPGLGGAVDPCKVVGVKVLYNSTGLWAEVTWEPPSNLGSSQRIVGYEVWWSVVTRSVHKSELTWYQFAANSTVRITNITDPAATSCTLGGLVDGTTYGVQVAAVGDYSYNVSQVLQYGLPFKFDVQYSTGLRVEDKESEGGSSLAVYIVCPIIFLLLALAASVLIYRRWKHGKGPLKRTKEKLQNYLTPTEPLNLRYKIWQDIPMAKTVLRELPPRTPDRWELPRSRIELGEVLGKGAFGEVFKGIIQGTILVNSVMDKGTKSNVEKHLNYTVAVKVLPVHAESREKEAFLQEIRVMKDIGYHRHVVSLIGCCVESDPVFLVEEYCPLGDLRFYLSSKRQAVMTCSVNDSGYDDSGLISTVTLTDLLSYARQIAIGMDYIHRKGYIHRDLAARNILLVDRSNVKIGDFGLTRYIYEDSIYVMQNAGKLPVKWMAIESIFDLTFTAASDVWAFGVVLFETITLGGTPYPTISNKDLLSELKHGYRMECPDNCPPDLYALMLQCWQLDPAMRPSFGQLQTELEHMLEMSAGSESYLQLDSNKDYYVAVNSEESIMKQSW